MPEGHRGILGFPLLLGLNTVRWAKSGTFEIGAPAQHVPPNLAYFENKLTLATTISGRQAFFTLDSGATSTDLNNNFIANFPELLTNAKTGNAIIGGAGGNTNFESLTISSLDITVAGTLLTLRPAVATRQSNPSLGSKCCIGNFGDDLLTSTGAFTLDLSRMTLLLDPAH